MRTISENCEDPNRILEAMRRTMKNTSEMIHSLYVVDLLRGLKKKRIGLKTVEDEAARMCRGLASGRQRTLVNTIMSWKLRDAYRKLQKARRDNTKVWREVRPILVQEGDVLSSYLRLWKSEKKNLKRYLTNKRKKKLAFLVKKYCENTCTVPDEVEGIVVKDQELDECFTSEPRCYGACKVNESERQTLSLPPKFALYTKVNILSVEEEIEKGLAKYRWEKKSSDKNEERANFVYDSDSKKLDFRNLRATDFSFNKRVVLPTALPDDQEIEIQHLKNKLMKTVDTYIRRNGGSKQWQNLTKDEERGLRSLKKRCKETEVVVYQTDKSGRFSIDTSDNYLLACEPHVAGDDVIMEQDYDRLQTEMNAHSILWTRILAAGKATGNFSRIKSNMITSDCPLAPLYTLRKDHKDIKDEIRGPPVRPVCGAVTAYNQRLSHLVSKILNEVWRDEESVCLSTEEMMADIRSTNGVLSEGVGDEVVVGSADVKALYPSLDVEFTVQKVCEVFIESGVSVEGVDVDELGLYLAVCRSEEELAGAGVACFCPTRKSSRGRHPVVTGRVLEDSKEKRFMSWKKPLREPNDADIRRMLGEALNVVLMFIMKNHVYGFGGIIKKQVKGGPIGLELTGVLAQVFMVWWDKRFKESLREMGIPLYMYKRYVDDINVVVGRVEPGTRFINGTLTVNDDARIQDKDRSTDEQCMALLKEIGNDIHKSIQIEVDYPSKHTDGKLPILDLKVWVEKKKIVRDGVDCYVHCVLHEFYSKEVSSKMVLSSRSALPWSLKRTVLTQEVLRVLLNCSPELPWQHVVEHANGMVKRIQYAGYDQRFRYDVVMSALSAYSKIKRSDLQGKRPMYRR